MIAGRGDTSLEQGDKVQAVDSGYLKIRDNDVDRVSTVFPQSFFAVFSEERLVTRSF